MIRHTGVIRRHVLLSQAETEWLLDRLGDDPFKLTKSLRHILWQFQDDATRVSETVARLNASSHYDEPVVHLRDRMTKQERKARAIVAALTDEERERLVKLLT